MPQPIDEPGARRLLSVVQWALLIVVAIGFGFVALLDLFAIFVVGLIPHRPAAAALVTFNIVCASVLLLLSRRFAMMGTRSRAWLSGASLLAAGISVAATLMAR